MANFDEVVNRRNTHSLKWDAYKQEDMIVMASADMDFKSAEVIREAFIARAEEGVFGYESKSDEYYQAIIQWNERRHNYKIKKEWLTNTPGMNLGIRLLIDCFTREGESVMMHGPYFSPLVIEIKKGKRNFVENPLVLQDGKYTIDFASFEEAMIKNDVKLFLMVNPQNPSGRVFTRSELETIADICEKHHVLVVSDEIHAEITFDGHKHIVYTSVNEKAKNHGIVITSATKAFNLQGLSYAIVTIPNEDLKAAFDDFLIGYNLNYATNIFSMAAIRSAYTKGEPWLNEVSSYLQANLDYLQDFLQAKAPAIKLIRPEAGYIAWLDFRAYGLSPEKLKEVFLEKAKVALSFGEEFGTEGHGFARINFATSRSTLTEALNRIVKTFEGEGVLK